MRYQAFLTRLRRSQAGRAATGIDSCASQPSTKTGLGRLLSCLLTVALVVGAFAVLSLVDAAIVLAQDGSAPPQQMNLLQWVYRALGLTYTIVFLSISFILVALIVMNLLTARRDNIVPAGLIEGFEAHLNEKRYQEAYEMAKSDESVLGQVLAAGLAKLSAGYQPAIEAMQEVGEEETMKLEHRLSYIALIGTISPMVGLLGTVHGMIAAFQEIAIAGQTPEAHKLAEGISTALFTTLLGLLIAIPAITVFNILRNRIARLLLEIGILSEGLMSRFQNVSTKKP